MQKVAIQKISDYLINYGYVKSVYLKGSIAEEKNDIYSSVDMFVILVEEKKTLFFEKIDSIFESYKTVYYLTKKYDDDFIITAIFDDGLEVNLIIENQENIKSSSQIMIVYDPEGLVKPKKKVEGDLSKIVEKFCYLLYSFEKSYKRKDYTYSYKLTGDLIYHLGLFLKQSFNNEVAQNTKRLKEFIPSSEYNKFIAIIKQNKYDTMLDSVKMMIVYVDTFISYLPLEIAMKINFDLYELTKKNILKIY